MRPGVWGDTWLTFLPMALSAVMRAQMPMHWTLDSTACERHLQLSQPSCRAIQKSIETLLPEGGRSKGADRSVRSILGCVSSLSNGCFFQMNCCGNSASPPHPAVKTDVITRCRMLHVCQALTITQWRNGLLIYR
ncbi:hypothetical protein BKA58DRAFT_38825 [Alternaria rosae]|uniref:uncharacterized protein n=1 Tax=Alternaria rosae TaxID=1187941 RepID=UPI001E8DA4C8|nr:uncharacterized protein BKA58DRAFT_38825 [Alternaria rosae]KAH6860728.1 hypothetical protein BKA58DRAFT_38825 [Alternaria rosae]